VKAPDFEYICADSVESARAAFAACRGDARYLAGGQSLLAALNLRLAAPDLLIDISRIASLRGIEKRDGEIRIGATTAHVEVMNSPMIAGHVPLLSRAVHFVAHPAIRNKGTIGGSLALADPAAEFPAVALALGARFEVIGTSGARFVAADDFFRGLYETALEPGELLAAVWFPCARPGQRFAFDELARRRGDFAIIGTAIAADMEGETVKDIRITFFPAGPTPRRARGAELALHDAPIDDRRIAAATAALAGDLLLDDDPSVSSATRLHLARVLLRRQLKTLVSNPTAEKDAP
jgi:aerobic carbon-monoxide dehydrogenase medium subunit